MAGFSHSIPALFLFVSLAWFTECYVMPVCSENGGVCGETGDEKCERNSIEHSTVCTTQLFAFVTNTMEATKRWLYEQVGVSYSAPVEEYKRTYMESMWTFFGFTVESKVTDSSSNTTCNCSILGLICASYFGYLFMATKCFNQRRVIDQTFFIKKFVNYLAPEQEDVSDADYDDEVEDLEFKHHLDLRSSKCKICEQHKLAIESTPDGTREVTAGISLPGFELKE